MEEVQNVKEILGIKESATEETLQSIDGTLKRIEKILNNYSNNILLDASVLAKEINHQLSEEMINPRRWLIHFRKVMRLFPW